MEPAKAGMACTLNIVIYLFPVKQIEPNRTKFQSSKRGKFLKKLWCCVGGSITR